MQQNVRKMYDKLIEKPLWQSIDADKTEEELSKELQEVLEKTINSISDKKIETMW
jgi:hypothetical protein